MQDPSDDPDLVHAKLTTETAKIPWRELQRFFAQGRAIRAAGGVDLVQLALFMTQDRSAEVRSLMDRGDIGPVSDDQAREWLESDASVWAVVVRPWVLVQAESERT